MINANDIRRGNFLFDNSGKIVKVESLDDQGINLKTPVYDDYDASPEYYYYDLAGISLEPELLEACGFEKRLINNKFWEYYIECTPPDYKREFRLVWWDWEKRMKFQPELDGSIHYFPCKYLHELQNLYKTICTKELEVKFPVNA